MTRSIAAISDVHGDAAALGAVLRWLDDKGVTEVVCAGDIAGFGPRPNECISLLVARDTRVVMGNGDYDLLHPPVSAAPASRSACPTSEAYLTALRLRTGSSWFTGPPATCAA